MHEAPFGFRSIFTLAVAAMAGATLIPGGAASATLAVAATLVLWRGAGRSGARETRWPRALAALTAALLVAAWLVERADSRYAESASTELERSHLALWEELDAYAEAAVTSLVGDESPPSDQRDRFARLSAAAASDADQRLHLLLWDRFGDLDGWWGRGLLPDLRSSPGVGRDRGVAQSALAVTLYVARRFRDAAGDSWTLVAAESFPRDGPPPVAHADRERWREVSWTLERPSPQSPDSWRLAAVAGIPRRTVRERLRDVATGTGGLLLLLWAAASAKESRRARGENAFAEARGGLRAAVGLGAGVALVAFGLGAAGEAAAALALAVIAGAVCAFAAARAARASAALRWASRVLGAATGPALLVCASRWPGAGDLVGDLGLLSASNAAWRIAISAVALAILALAAAGAGAGSSSGRPRTRLAEVWPAAAAVTAAMLVDWSWPATAALALAGYGAVDQLAAWRHRALAGRLGSVMLASLVAAAAWSAGARRAETSAINARLSTFLPPSANSMTILEDRVEQDLERLDPTALLPPGNGSFVPEDLAYAIWRRSPLARNDVLSSLVVIGPAGGRAMFSSGLPIDADGSLDLSPARWVDLAPVAWLDRRIGREIALGDAQGRPWSVRWLAVPLPGFAATSEPPSSRERPAAARAERFSAARLPERMVIYDASGRVVRSPWPEGTPALVPELLVGEPFLRLVATPDGPAFAAALRDGGMTAAAFVPRTSAWQALERSGSFVAGAWTPVLAVGLFLGLWLVPWSTVADELRALWGSYSGRLVLVFTLLLLAPLAVGSTWVAHSYARRLERQQEIAALDSLHSAQRVLGEYVLSLEPGFGVGTAVDDRLLEWLARVVRSEVHLYWGSELYASSKRDLFEAGLLPTRLPGEVWERVHLRGERVVRRTVRGADGETVETYAPLEIPGESAEATKLVLSLPRMAQQGELAEEIAAIRRRAFLTAAALAVLLAVSGALLARRFSRPIEEIVRGTQRIAEGASTLGYVPAELELEALASAIDHMAQRVAEARERLTVEKSLVEKIAENVTAAVVGLDAAGRVVFANRLAREMLHASPGEVLRERLRGGGIDSLAEAFAAGASTAEATTTRVDLGGEERDWTLVRAPLPGPGDPAELVVVEDVTAVVRAQRLDAWAGMARIIAHEIKNPLTPIRLSAEHLREAWARDREHFETVFERCTSNILRQVEELRRIASEFSLYSEIPRIERREDDLREVISEVVEAYGAAPPAGVEIHFAAGAASVPAVFDRRLLGRAVRNLIENAVRASGESGRVEIAIEERSDEVAVRVADQGPGVSEALLGRVVEPYFSTQSGGTGLGLPIARRVAEEHGGGLTLRNIPSGGLEVTITIPRR